jgi:hypothetical protein
MLVLPPLKLNLSLSFGCCSEAAAEVLFFHIKFINCASSDTFFEVTYVCHHLRPFVCPTGHFCFIGYLRCLWLCIFYFFFSYFVLNEVPCASSFLCSIFIIFLFENFSCVFYPLSHIQRVFSTLMLRQLPLGLLNFFLCSELVPAPALFLSTNLLFNISVAWTQNSLHSLCTRILPICC